MTLTKDDFTIQPNGYLFYRGVPVHRLIASLMLDRPLYPDEVVHHENGNKLDCRPQNLTIMKSGEHHPRLAPHDAEQTIVLPSQDWLAKLETIPCSTTHYWASGTESTQPMIRTSVTLSAKGVERLNSLKEILGARNQSEAANIAIQMALALKTDPIGTLAAAGVHFDSALNIELKDGKVIVRAYQPKGCT